jgi:superoxide dismutase, Cu-Zn family
MNRWLFLSIKLFGCSLLLVGCKPDNTKMSGPQAMMQMAGKVAVAEVKPSKAATTQPTNSNVTGTVTFTEMGNMVKVTAHIMGLAPNSTHGFHIHEKGDLSAPDLSSAGGHFNPGGHQHGAPGGMSHEGDLGNLKADGMGMAMYDATVEGISVGTGEKNDIVGKSVIIHSGQDDLKTQPTGNSGGRVAGGVIELKK